MALSSSVRTSRPRRAAGPSRRRATARRRWHDLTAAPSRRHAVRRASTGVWAAGTGGTVVRSDRPPLVEAELARLIVLLGLAAATIGFILPALLQAAAGSAH